MLSWILHHAGRHPNFLIGGVAENFGRSFGLGGGKEFVLEGDEYDSAFFDKAPKFLHYHPTKSSSLRSNSITRISTTISPPSNCNSADW